MPADTGPRRKPRVLPRAYTRPELPTRILDYTVPFQDHFDPEASSRILISNEAIPLDGILSLRDEDPPRRLSLRR